MQDCASQLGPEKPCLLIIDSKKLRQAGIVHLLGAWAGAMGLTVNAVTSGSPMARDRKNATCEMVILSVGSASVEHPEQQALIKSLRKQIPRARLVVISDREEPKEVCAAFKGGAAGFMPP